MPWAEKDMTIVLKEADHLRMSVPLCGVVKEVVKTVKFERNWPTPHAPDGIEWQSTMRQKPKFAAVSSTSRCNAA